MTTLPNFPRFWGEGTSLRYSLSTTEFAVFNGFLAILLTAATGALLHLLVITYLTFFNQRGSNARCDQAHVLGYNAQSPGEALKKLLSLQWTYDRWRSVLLWRWDRTVILLVFLAMLSIGAQVGGVFGGSRLVRSGSVPQSGNVCGIPLFNSSSDNDAFAKQLVFEVPLAQDYANAFRMCTETPDTDGDSTNVICPMPRGGKFQYNFTIAKDPSCWSESFLEEADICRNRWRHIGMEATVSLQDMGIVLQSQVELTTRSRCDQIDTINYEREEKTIAQASLYSGFTEDITTADGGYVVTSHVDDRRNYEAPDSFKVPGLNNGYVMSLIGISVGGVRTRGENNDTLFGSDLNNPDCKNEYCRPAQDIGVLLCWDDHILRTRDGKYSHSGTAADINIQLQRNSAFSQSQKDESYVLLSSIDDLPSATRSIRLLGGLSLNASVTIKDGNQYRKNANLHEEIKRWFGVDVIRRLSWAQAIAGLPSKPSCTVFWDFRNITMVHSVYSQSLANWICDYTLFAANDLVSISVPGTLAFVVVCLLVLGLGLLDGHLLKLPRYLNTVIWMELHGVLQLHRLAFQASTQQTVVASGPISNSNANASVALDDPSKSLAVNGEIELQPQSATLVSAAQVGQLGIPAPLALVTQHYRRTLKVNYFSTPKLEGPQPSYGLSRDQDLDAKLVTNLSGNWEGIHSQRDLAG